MKKIFFYPVNNFTIGGKIESIFNNITLANDLEFKYSENCPTALIAEGLVVGGC
jgi:PmbA protein